jgi:uracil phosphoribosyltransferase
MAVSVSDHPLVAHKITMLRDETTDSVRFRHLTKELVTLLAYEATRSLELTDTTVTTPIQKTTGKRLVNPRPLVVPILRAGLGMLDGMLEVIPSASVGFLGMVRNEDTLQATTYAERLPKNLTGQTVYVLDPMLATGGSLLQAIRFLNARGAKNITAICLLAAPEGIAHVTDGIGDMDVDLVIGTLDERLNDIGYIVPGLGDAGDRLYGNAGDH